MKTPLYEEHVSLGARIVPFSGWDMPLLYKGILPEHRQTRESASVFDTCHMGVFDISGDSALSDLEMLLTQSVHSLKPGACSYGYLLAEDGGVLDDIICFRRSDNSFRIIVNAGTRDKDAAWIGGRLSSGSSFNDASGSTAKLDVQGPRSKRELEKALGVSLPELGFFRFRETMVMDVPFMISRTGYTGEWGYELLFPADEAPRFWRLFLEKSDIRPAGLGARDVLRMEMGFPLYGNELSEEHTPVPVCRGRFIDTSKDFTGKAAVMRDIENGTDRVLAGLCMEERRAARPHDTVMHDGKAVGEVTSGLFAPSIGKAVALANIDPALSETGRKLSVLVRGNTLPAVVADLPFYRNGTARKKVSE